MSSSESIHSAENLRPRGLRFLVDAINLEPQESPGAWQKLAASHGDTLFLARKFSSDKMAHAVGSLRAIFASNDDKTAALQINELLNTATTHSKLHQLPDGRWALRPDIADAASAAEALTTLGAFALAEWLAERGRCSWGICEATNCERVFIDEGRRQAQKFCSTTCSSRTRVSALRQRRTAAEA